MEIGLKEAAAEAKKEGKMEMGLKEAAVEVKKEDKSEQLVCPLKPPKDPPEQFRLRSNHALSGPIHA